MECPYLSGLYMKYCIAEKYDYVPSVYELREYCKEHQHRVCQYYLRADAAMVTNALQLAGETRFARYDQREHVRRMVLRSIEEKHHEMFVSENGIPLLRR